jgi:very-short-patch-repair endonuclease
MSNFNNYNKKLKPFARKLRNNTTKSEANLWLRVLKARQLKGYQFLRQRPIGKYIVDFFCRELKLIIELDGVTHIQKESYDKKREEYLKSLGYNFIRFYDNDVMNNLNGVFMYLENWIEEYENMHPEVLKIKGRKYRTSPSAQLVKEKETSPSIPLNKGEVTIIKNTESKNTQSSFPPSLMEVKQIERDASKTSFPPLKGGRGDGNNSKSKNKLNAH